MCHFVHFRYTAQSHCRPSHITQRSPLTTIPEQAAEAVKQAVPESTGEAKGQANEVAGQAKGKANELAGEAKGKAAELQGEAKKKM
jgi:regulator of protease activity HflC (stomatin/prohibitin superfamily)